MKTSVCQCLKKKKNTFGGLGCPKGLVAATAAVSQLKAEVICAGLIPKLLGSMKHLHIKTYKYRGSDLKLSEFHFNLMKTIWLCTLGSIYWFCIHRYRYISYHLLTQYI